MFAEFREKIINPHEREQFVQEPASAILGATRIIHAKTCHHNYKGIASSMGLVAPCGASDIEVACTYSDRKNFRESS